MKPRSETSLGFLLLCCSLSLLRETQVFFSTLPPPSCTHPLVSHLISFSLVSLFPCQPSSLLSLLLAMLTSSSVTEFYEYFSFTSLFLFTTLYYSIGNTIIKANYWLIKLYTYFTIRTTNNVYKVLSPVIDWQPLQCTSPLLMSAGISTLTWPWMDM